MMGNPMQPLCGAFCRTTSQACKNFPMANGRCRMHGGKSTGRPVSHGYYTAEAIDERKALVALIRGVQELTDHLEVSDEK